MEEVAWIYALGALSCCVVASFTLSAAQLALEVRAEVPRGTSLEASVVKKVAVGRVELAAQAGLFRETTSETWEVTRLSKA